MFRNRNPQRELDRKLNLFRESFLLLIADGLYPPERQQRLYQAARHAGLDWQLARRYVVGEAKAFFEDSIRRVIADGRITPDEIKDLLSLQRRLGLELDNAPLLERVFAIAEQKIHAMIVERAAYLSNKKVVEGLKQNISDFSLPRERTDRLYALLDEQHAMAKLMIGELPILQPSVTLYKNEVCHLDIPASFLPDGAPAKESASGKLLVTSERVMFLGAENSFAATWSEMKHCKMYEHGVMLRYKTSIGLIFCANPQYVATLIIGASHVYNRARMPAPSNKRLPDLSNGVDL
ncbi:hypothetical protein [Candidatus Oscillochloris fontis]|uniref:hypothetical protein n=1 Tax=Candidatus Oscillochloris fontis TaxID=2496868 RepID=UPI00101BA572|nr:hypothetical protein [Candidatus Oscillochloris fontis]